MTISIPKSCNEKWDNFTPTTQGGFCSSCQKDVIDFTSWSDDQIKSFFTKHSTGVCGKFKSTQLTTYGDSSYKSLPSFKWMSASLLSFSLLLSPKATKAQSTIETTEVYQTLGFTVMPDLATSMLSPPLSGIVWLNEYERAKGAAIKLKGTEITTETDSLGRFSLALPKDTTSDTLIFSAKGMLDKEIKLRQQVHLTVMFDESLSHALTGRLGGVTVGVTPRRRGVWNKIKNIFKRN